MEIQTPIVMDKIATFLGHKDLKSCKQLNSAWNAIANRTLRLRKCTSILVSPKSVKHWLKSEEVFWNTVNLDWTFGDSVQGIERDQIEIFFQKFGQYVECLNWTGADLHDKDHKISKQQLGEFLHWMPNLQTLSIGCPGNSLKRNVLWNYYHHRCIPVTSVLLAAQQNFNLNKLNSLHISRQANLTDRDMHMLITLAPQLPMKTFSFRGYISNADQHEGMFTGLTLPSLIECWAETLEELYVINCDLFGFFSPMKALRRFSSNFLPVDFLATYPLVEMFPVLEELSIYVVEEFDWMSFLPEEMPNHLNLRSLILLHHQEDGDGDFDFLWEFVEKCPNLKYLGSSIELTDQDRTAFLARKPELEIWENGTLVDSWQSLY